MIDNLKLAIENEDWAGVISFYSALTGDVVARKADKKPKGRKTKESVNDLTHVDVLPAFALTASKATTRHSNLDNFIMRPNKAVGKAVAASEEPKSKIKPGRKKKPVTKPTNITFIDTGERVDEELSGQINDNVTPTPRTRKPFKPVTATCSQCNRKEEINPLFKKSKELYKCDSCLLKGKVNGP